MALYDLELQELDIKIAFLHGELEVTIYMHKSGGSLLEVNKIMCAD